MKVASKSVPNGALPYENIPSATKMMAKLFEQNPYLPFLPNVINDDNILTRTLSNIPGIKLKDRKVFVNK